MNEPRNKAVTELGTWLLAQLTLAEVDANQDRWSDGVEHHPMSEMIVRQLAELDFMFYGDYFCWKVGGDGDNGEILMYELDVLFDMYDKLTGEDPWAYEGGVMAHTPGPWEIDYEWHTAINKGAKHIAMVNFFNDPDPEKRVTMEECNANAILIAAAPEMLEALKAIRYTFEKGDNIHIDIKQMVHAVIAKAEGQP